MTYEEFINGMQDCAASRDGQLVVNVAVA